MPKTRKPRTPTRRQASYLRFLERATDNLPAKGLTSAQASTRISNLKREYEIIYDRQPMMRGR